MDYWSQVQYTKPYECRPTVRQLREELQLLQEPGSYVGEIIKVMGKKKVLCKVTAAPAGGPDQGILG